MMPLLTVVISYADPKVSINVLSWTSDILTVAVFSSVLLAFLLLAVVAALWYSKSQHRHTERLQRRNSIRQSLNSLRSLSSSQTGFNELGFKRKTLSVSLMLVKCVQYLKKCILMTRYRRCRVKRRIFRCREPRITRR